MKHTFALAAAFVAFASAALAADLNLVPYPQEHPDVHQDHTD